MPVHRIFGILAFFVPLFVVSGGAHWIVATWAMRVFPRLARYRRQAKFLVAALVLAAPLSRVIARSTHSLFVTELVAVFMIELMVIMMSLPLLLAAMGVARLMTRRRADADADSVNDADSVTNPDSVSDAETDADSVAGADSDSDSVTRADADVPKVGRREVIERVGGLLALGATGSMLGWGIVRGRHAFEVDEIVVRIPGLPKALEGYTIAQVSDLHAGVHVLEADLLEGLSRVAETKPDLIVATGDLVDFDPDYAPLLARVLSSLKSRDGIYAILGNHDYYSGADEVVEIVERTPIRMLVNAGRVIRAGDGGGFALLGVDDLWAGRSGGAGPDLDAAIAQVPKDAPRILLAHQPNYIRQAAGKVALQLSGHTHGGQINPGFKPGKLFMPYLAGRYDVGGTTLYVNRGFGVVGPPARIGAPPEVTKVVLVSG